MGYLVEVGKNNEILLPDELCNELNISIGDIFICKLTENSTKIEMTKHTDQTLSDAEIVASANLTRVTAYPP